VVQISLFLGNVGRWLHVLQGWCESCWGVTRADISASHVAPFPLLPCSAAERCFSAEGYKLVEGGARSFLVVLCSQRGSTLHIGGAGGEL